MGGGIAVGVRKFDGLENGEDWGGWKPRFRSPSTFTHFASNRSRQFVMYLLVQIENKKRAVKLTTLTYLAFWQLTLSLLSQTAP